MRVSMREFLADVEALSEQAMAEPLSITADGKDSLVLLSAAEYEHLTRRDRRVVLTTEWTEEELELLAKTEMPPEYDHLNDLLTDWKA